MTKEYLHKTLTGFNEEYEYNLSRPEIRDLVTKSLSESVRVDKKVRKYQQKKHFDFLCTSGDPPENDPELEEKFRQNDELGGWQKLAGMLNGWVDRKNLHPRN